MKPKEFGLTQIPGAFAVARLPGGSDIPEWAAASAPFSAFVRAPDELSIVFPEAAVPDHVRAERGWACLRVDGPLAFSEIGVLASIAEPLAAVAVSIFVVSTYDTDYILVPAHQLAAAGSALRSAGHELKLL